MRLHGPRCSFREDAADMAGAIFMSNSETRDHCFNSGVFGLPPEYGPFVANVKQGMPLFLFDYSFRKLYGVFEAASDGGMDVSRTAFRSTGRTYPAQVCFNIVWKCRPLTEDEFFPAIEENYYISKKFYFDLSYQQVVQLYGLFDKKRVEHPICNYSASANLEKEHSSRRRPDRRSLTPNSPPFSADRSHTLIPSSTMEWLHVKLPELHPNTWSMDILCDQRFLELDRAKIITVMWAIWTSRNNITHDRGSIDPVFSIKRIKDDLALLDIPLEHAKIMPGYGWRLLEEDWVKINTDAGISTDSNKGGAGGVARSPTAFLAAWSRPYPGIADPLVAEALALRDGVIFTKLRGFTRVVLEVDCLEVVCLWDSRLFSRSLIAPILAEIEGLASSFVSFCIQHVSRNSNFSSHLCAKHASTLEVSSCWMDSPLASS